MQGFWFNLIFWGFVAFYLFVTFYLGKKAPSLGDFYNMNQGAGPYLVAGTYAATWISAYGMIGVAGTSYSIAPLAGILMWGAMYGYAITGFWIGPRLRRFGQVTLGDFFGDRFDSDTLRLISSFIVIIGLSTYFISQTMGSAIVTNMIFGIDYNICVIVMTVIFVIIAAGSGSQSVTITDTIMLVVIVVALAYVFTPVLLSNLGGVEAFGKYAKENPTYFTYGGGKIAFTTIVGWQLIWALGNASMPQAITRVYLARSNGDWYKSIVLALVLTLSTVWLTHFASGMVRIANPNLASGSESLLWAAKNLVPEAIGALCAAGLFAAALSSATTQVLYLAFAVTRDIYEKVMIKDKRDMISDQKLMNLNRIWIIIFGIMAGVFAILRPATIVDFGNLAASIFASSFFPALMLGLYWRECTKEGAIAGMVIGFISILVFSYGAYWFGVPFGDYSYMPFGLHPIYYGVGVSLVVIYIVSKMTKLTPKQIEVFELVSKPGPADRVSPGEKASLKNWVWFTAAYMVLQTGVIFWLASYV